MTNTELIRTAHALDIDVCRQFDHRMERDVMLRQIADRRIVVAEREKTVVGYLRVDYLWSEVPYLALVRVLEEHRNSGIGRKMLAFTERQLAEKGHRFLLSSSQVDEASPQAWHRRQGFVECGILAGINAGGIGELFFRKDLEQQE